MADVLKYSPDALKDLDSIFDYIAFDLKEPNTAESFIKCILSQHNKLKDFPGIGAIYKLPNGVETVYRYLVYKGYLSFYRVVNGTIYIDRVLNGKTDYIGILFGSFDK